ncbi:hypothetical protein MPLDJ20_140417 [Mesorhizobium plurifarium]|uniref:Uncharacterized protein n=1 Tax=Mesorhizobium plurifarium TaxID=69974 RepID=A0A090ERQ2_MESPL|nr:hypothetical protein MPLDJ20_140417 [Mesorhizobium plurifarium]
MMLPNPFEPAFETCLIETGYSTGKTLPQRDLGKCEVGEIRPRALGDCEWRCYSGANLKQIEVPAASVPGSRGAGRN